MSRPVEPGRRGRTSRGASTPTTRGGRAVVGFDATTASHDALAYAIGWARRVHGALDVLYVADNPWQWTVDAGTAAYPVAAGLPGIADLMAGTVTGVLAGTGLDWRYRTAAGGVAQALEQYADSVDADVIVIGRPRRRRAHPARGSVGHRLLSHSERIVIIVP